MGVPHPPLNGGGILSWLGYLPQLDLANHQEGIWDKWKYYGMEIGYPQKGHETSGGIMGWTWHTPRKVVWPVEVLWDGDGVPPPPVWTDWKHNLPHPLGARGINMATTLQIYCPLQFTELLGPLLSFCRNVLCHKASGSKRLRIINRLPRSFLVFCTFKLNDFMIHISPNTPTRVWIQLNQAYSLSDSY